MTPRLALLSFAAALTMSSAAFAQSGPTGGTSGHQVEPSLAVGETHSCASYYPSISQRLNESGDVLVGYDVGVDGTISNVVLGKSSGHPLLDDAAIKCVSEHWRNTPAMLDGKPVASPGHQAIIRFSLREPSLSIGEPEPKPTLDATAVTPPPAPASDDNATPELLLILGGGLALLALFTLGWLVYRRRRS